MSQVSYGPVHTANREQACSRMHAAYRGPEDLQHTVFSGDLLCRKSRVLKRTDTSFSSISSTFKMLRTLLAPPTGPCCLPSLFNAVPSRESHLPNRSHVSYPSVSWGAKPTPRTCQPLRATVTMIVSRTTCSPLPSRGFPEAMPAPGTSTTDAKQPQRHPRVRAEREAGGPSIEVASTLNLPPRTSQSQCSSVAGPEQIPGETASQAPMG